MNWQPHDPMMFRDAIFRNWVPSQPKIKIPVTQGTHWAQIACHIAPESPHGPAPTATPDKGGAQPDEAQGSKTCLAFRLGWLPQWRPKPKEQVSITKSLAKRRPSLGNWGRQEAQLQNNKSTPVGGGQNPQAFQRFPQPCSLSISSAHWRNYISAVTYCIYNLV